MPKRTLSQHEKADAVVAEYPREFKVVPVEVDFVKQYIESRLSKMPDLQTVLTSSRTLNPADYASLQNSPASDAPIERSFLKLRKLLQKDRSFADKNLTFYVNLMWTM